jgi:hypothetical protein
MNALATNASPAGRSWVGALWRQTAALRAGVIAGAVAGVILGGVGGRLAMRLVALIDASTSGLRTDFGATVGVITAGGTLTLISLAMLAGIGGGVLYVAIRRWLPGSGRGRGLVFGVLMVFGPGILAIGETDLQIFRPALPIFAIFAALETLYGLAVALLADGLNPPPPVRSSRRLAVVLRGLHCASAVVVCLFAFLVTMNILVGEGTCLTAGAEGGCAVRTAR